MNKLAEIIKYRNSKNICILGFAREGKSTFAFLNENYPCRITIADQNPDVFKGFEKQGIKIQTGIHYLEHLEDYDLIIRSPGIKLPLDIEEKIKDKLTSQAAIFLQAYHRQIIGITGTKGKSTTSSLIYHILKENGCDTVLVGNIGIPFFDLVSQINEKTIVVCELSAQQLYEVEYSPHIALFLNLFSDHIDFFGNMERYGMAKYNIFRFQKVDDFFIYHYDCEFVKKIKNNSALFTQSIAISEHGSAHFDCHDGVVNRKEDKDVVLDFKKTPLKGAHNFINMLFALEAVTCCGISFEDAIPAVYSFTTLANRLEFVGCFDNKCFYNDSIATVPEAAVAALHAIENVQTIILGGYDRGVHLEDLMTAVAKSGTKNIIFSGPSGRRMMEILNKFFPDHKKDVFYFEHYEGLVEKAIEITPENSACVLAPASPSFDSFENFEARGTYFKETIKKYFIAKQKK